MRVNEAPPKAAFIVYRAWKIVWYDCGSRSIVLRYTAPGNLRRGFQTICGQRTPAHAQMHWSCAGHDPVRPLPAGYKSPQSTAHGPIWILWKKK